ncbi:MAG: FHA domain-containing protein [Lacrimispora sp.]|uniref:FHA domain-containing protein n=1 Tax=Lacrimispora sp. TaxID=2719234 RepID=UPI0039E46BBA
MKNNREKKIRLDITILIISCIFAASAYMLQVPPSLFYMAVILSLVLCAAAAADLYRLKGQKDYERETAAGGRGSQYGACELILLNEEEKPVKSWDLTGEVSVIIGRKSKDEDVDVDLGECEYSAMIDVQHATLNFCLNSWYLEDLDSHNGVKVRKIEDGVCYRLVQSRPCRISPGDVIYIANTKLLFT